MQQDEHGGMCNEKRNSFMINWTALKRAVCGDVTLHYPEVKNSFLLTSAALSGALRDAQQVPHLHYGDLVYVLALYPPQYCLERSNCLCRCRCSVSVEVAVIAALTGPLIGRLVRWSADWSTDRPTGPLIGRLVRWSAAQSAAPVFLLPLQDVVVFEGTVFLPSVQAIVAFEDAVFWPAPLLRLETHVILYVVNKLS